MRIDGNGRRRGFSLVELTVASFLMVMVAAVLARSWAAFGRSAISTVARARIAQEANLAAAALSRDLGLLARPLSRVTDSRYQGIQPNTDGTAVSFSIDDGSGTTRIVQYTRDRDDPSKLVRTDLTSSEVSPRVVANLVSEFQATALTLPNSFGANGVQVDLSFTHWTYDKGPDGRVQGVHTRRFTLFIPDPSP